MTDRACVYGRQSSGKAKSIKEQIAAGHITIATNGWRHAGDYSDGTSASRYKTKKRDDWERLLEDIRNNAFDIVILWESSRGDRTLSSWALFLDECRDRHIRIHVIADDHTYDLDRPRDWKTLANAGVDNAAETDMLSIRTRRGHAGAAAEGKPPGGPTPFGYRRTFDPSTGARTGQVKHPDEAAVVVEIFQKIARGHTVLGLVNDLNERQVPWRGGKPWSRDAVRFLLRNPAYVGVRSLNGIDYEGQWEPIVEPRIFQAVQRVLNAPERRTTRPGSQKHLLSYLALCAVCDGWIDVARNCYKCRDAGCVSMPQGVADDIVAGQVLDRLCGEDILPALADDEDDTELLEVRAEAVDLRAQLAAWRDSAVRGETSPESLAVIEAGLKTRIKAADARARELATPAPLRALLEPGADVRRIWAGAPTTLRRQFIGAVAEVRIDVGRPGRYPAAVGVLEWNLPRLGRSRWHGDKLSWAQRWAL